jgi:hypothetical protein
MAQKVPIPTSLAPFFQEYDLATLNPETASFTLIERTLQFGNRAEIRWLFRTYSREQITNWIRRFAEARLPEPHRTFRGLVLEIDR